MASWSTIFGRVARRGNHLRGAAVWALVCLSRIVAGGAPTLPAQPDRTVNELTSLTVTNSASAAGLVVQWGTNTYVFSYVDRNALVAEGWSFQATALSGALRDTEVSGAAAISYDQVSHPGVLRVPCDMGDLWGTGASVNNTRNSLFHALPTNWVSAQLDLAFAPAGNFQQAHLGLYQDDDNYLQVGVAYNGSRKVSMDVENGGQPTTLASLFSSGTSFSFRWTREVGSGAVTASFSLDGANWVNLATVPQTLGNPRLAVWVGGATVAYTSGGPAADLRRVQVVTSNIAPVVLSYQLLTAPPGASIDNYGVVSWTPSEAQGPSTNTLITVVKDNGAPSASATNSFKVLVNEINSPPGLTVQNNRILFGLQPLVVPNSATDSDIPNNNLNYQLSGPTGALIDASGIISWMPSIGQVPSTNVFRTVVTDHNPWAVNAQELSATNSFVVVVNAIHNGPVLAALADVTMAQYSTLRVTNTASDVDVPPLGLTYQLVNPPAGASISPDGIISWSPGEGQGHTTNTLTTLVSDAGVPSLSATNSFKVVVNEINVAPVLPVQVDRSLMGTQSVVVVNTATQADMPPVTLSYRLTGPVGAAIDANGVITWTPSAGQVPSTNVFTTAVTNYNPWAVNAPQLGATNMFTVSVYPVHNGPVLSVQTNVTMNELTSLIVTNRGTSSDVPPLALNYKLLNPPSGATINTNGVIIWTPTETQGPSTNVLTTVVTDAGTPPLSATNSFTVVVNEFNTPPMLPGLADQTLSGLQSMVVTNAATDSDIPANSLSYSFLTAPAGAIINSNGVITWTPSVAQVPGAYLFRTVVTDFNPVAVNSQRLSTTNSFTVLVNAVHNGPTLPPQTNVTFAELTRLTVTNTAVDTDVPALGLHYRLISAPPGAEIDGNGIITWTPTEAQGPSTNTFVTLVYDDGSPSYSEVNTFDVVVSEINVAPVLPVQSNRTLVAQQTLSVTNTATDVDIPTNSLSYTLLTAPTGASISSDGIISWTPSLAQVPSTNLITTVVMDSNPWAANVRQLSATNSFTVVVNAIHNGPVLPVQTNLTIAQYSTMTVTNTASDADVPPPALVYSLLNPPAGVTISTNGVITWAPGAGQGHTTNTITTVVTDTATPPLSATNTFTVVVNEINVVPVLPIQANRTVFGQQTLMVTNTATEPDMPPVTLTYVLTGPTGAVIDSNGVITWTPSLAQLPSTNVFTTVVTDHNPWAVNAQQLSATNTFTVVASIIHNGPVLPVQTNLTIAQYSTMTVTNTANDADAPLPALVYSLLNPPAGVTISTNGVITWAPGAGQGHTTNTITTVVTDTATPPLSATNTFTVVVNEINVAPVLPVQPNRNLVAIQALTVTNTATAVDMPPVTLTYQLTGPAGAIIDANGVINWTPTLAQVPSSNLFTTVVTGHNPWAVNNQHITATNSFAVVVNAIHNGPVLPDQTNRTIAQYSTLVVTNTAVDNDIPLLPLTYNLITAPTGANINANGVITWTPGAGHGHSTNLFTTVVFDNGTPQKSSIKSFTVVVNEMNQPPVLPAQTDRTLAGTQTLTVVNTATDPDIPAETLTYQLLTAPSGATISASGIITWTPTAAQVPSTNVFTTAVTDSNPWAVNNQHLSATNTFKVVVNATAGFRITSVRISGQYALVTFDSVAGNTYRLHYRDSMNSGNWQAVTPDVTATSTSTTITNALGGARQRFYRVEWVQSSTAPNFRITGVRPSGQSAVVTFESLTGHTYRLQYLENLNSGSWQSVVPDVVATGTSTAITNSLGSATRRFFRVQYVQ